MMEWRELLYPLGFISSLAFSSRFLLQWFQSEKEGKSVVNTSFWKISLIGNLVLVLHAFIQVQFHVSLVQACNGVIAWRNLDLMNTSKKPHSLLFVILMMALTIASITGFYTVQSLFLSGDSASWFRSPFSSDIVHPLWHVLGAVGLVLFNSRFWIQWWDAERAQESRLGLLFWWTSVVGGLFTIVYFIKLGDPVNLVGPACGMIPYIRNLMLIYKNQRKAVVSGQAT